MRRFAVALDVPDLERLMRRRVGEPALMKPRLFHVEHAQEGAPPLAWAAAVSMRGRAWEALLGGEAGAG